MRQDLVFALRTFRKNPGFAAVVVASIALGIAANTTVFSIVNGLLFGSLPVKEPSRLVVFNGGNTTAWRNYVDFRDGSKDVFEGVSAHFPIAPASVGGRGEPERVWGQLVTANYFDVVKPPVALGRGFLPYEDEAPRRNAVVVLGHSLWMRRFGGDPSIIGREVMLSGFPYKVVGVTAPGYHGSDRGLAVEFWVPLSMVEQLVPDLGVERRGFRASRTASWLVVNARLRPGVTVEKATAAVGVIQGRIDDELKREKDKRRAVMLSESGGLIDGLDRKLLPLLAVMMIVVGLVLTIACANVANIMLAKASARRKEIGIRLAVGAPRSRLIRQLLTESILLSGAGAAVGFLLAWQAAAAISAIEPPMRLPIVFDFSPDWRVLTFTAALAVLSGILFGMAPAARATRPDLVTSLRNDTAALGSARRFGLRNTLVVLQVSVSVILLVGATLFLRSLRNAASIDTGMRPDGVLMMAFDPKLNGYSEERTKVLLQQLRSRVEAMPAVSSVTFLDSIPLSIGGTSFDFKLGESKSVNANVYYSGRRFFETMGIPLLRGRDFHAQDKDVAIINQTMAQRLFGDADPLGQDIVSEKAVYRVIGVSRDAKSRTLAEDPVNCAYLFLEGAPDKVISFYGISIVVKTTANVAGSMKAIRDQILSLDPNLAVFGEQSMREHVDNALMLPRISAALLGVCGATGLLLAAIGLYGVLSFGVRSRSREIGIRMALGAEKKAVLAMVTRQGLMLAGLGLVTGLVLAWMGSRYVASLLYGLNPADPFTFVAVPLVLLAVAAVAILVPAGRAAKVDPVLTLREE